MKFKKPMVIKELVIALACSLLVPACTTVQFSVESTPSNVMILRGTNKKAYGISKPIPVGISPVKEKLFFMGKNNGYYYTSLKRGFYNDTIFVNKMSDTIVKFDLKPNLAISKDLPDTTKLSAKKFILLPLVSNIFLHKGVGEIHNYKFSKDLSEKSSKYLNEQLKKSEASIVNLRMVDFKDEKLINKWEDLHPQLTDYMLGIEPYMLYYYGIPPNITPLLKHFNTICTSIENTIKPQDTSTYLLFISCKSIKPTISRAIGNVGVAVAQGAVTGYNNAMYGANNFNNVLYQSNPVNFTQEDRTLISAYVIDSKTNEVLAIRQRVVNYNISEENEMNKIVGMIRSLQIF